MRWSAIASSWPNGKRDRRNASGGGEPPAHAVAFSRRRYVLRSLERLVYIDDFFICGQYIPDWCELQAF
ncbi:hypothetical protein WJ52_23935 [Burkholderia ubonensis]|nr:hypothetical protein WJ52_23935 [Burkholderia ubonensis]